MKTAIVQGYLDTTKMTVSIDDNGNETVRSSSWTMQIVNVLKQHNVCGWQVTFINVPDVNRNHIITTITPCVCNRVECYNAGEY